MRRFAFGTLAAIILASGAGRAAADLVTEVNAPVDVSGGILTVPAGGFTDPVAFTYSQGIFVRNADPFTYLFTLSTVILVESLPSYRFSPGGVFRVDGLISFQSLSHASSAQNYPVSFTLDAATLNAAVVPGDTQLRVVIAGAAAGGAVVIPEPPTLAAGGIGVLAVLGGAWRRRKRARHG